MAEVVGSMVEVQACSKGLARADNKFEADNRRVAELKGNTEVVLNVKKLQYTVN